MVHCGPARGFLRQDQLQDSARGTKEGLAMGADAGTGSSLVVLQKQCGHDHGPQLTL